MEFITKEDFFTHMYEGAIDAISEEDDAKLEEAIHAAIGEATGYLHRFDLDAILTSTDRVTYASLRTWVKDIAKWHFINLCNVSVDLELAETRYTKAITELGKIQAGKVVPRGWALPPDSGDGIDDSVFYVSSRPKRGNYIN